MSALAELEKRLQNTSGLIIQYEHALANPDNTDNTTSLSVSIRSLQKLHRRLEAEFLELAAIEEQEVYRYRIIDTSERPTLGGIGEAWAEFQKLFATVYQKLTNQELPSALGYSYCFAGSVGVVVTLPKLPQQQAGMLAANPIDDTSEIVFDLIESRRVTEIARQLGPEPIAAMNDWLSVHMRHGYGLGLEWQSERVTKRRTEISSANLQSLQTTIAETTSDVTLVLDGELFAIDTEARIFKIRPDTDEVIEGTFANAITAEHEASVPHRYKATIIKTTRMVRTKKDKPVTYFLEKLDPL
jgi:hypothetical protein